MRRFFQPDKDFFVLIFVLKCFALDLSIIIESFSETTKFTQA